MPIMHRLIRHRSLLRAPRKLITCLLLKWTLAVSLLCGVSVSARNFADDAMSLSASAPVSLSDALKMAEEYNVQLQVEEKNLELGKADIQMARYLPNPEFAGVFSAGNIVTTLGNPQQVGVNWLLETAGKRRKRTNLAVSQYDLTHLNYGAARWEIRSDVRAAYSNMLAAEQKQAVILKQMKLLDELVEIAMKRYRAGVASGAEVQQALLARQQMDVRKNEAIARIEQAQLQLNSLLGNKLPPLFEISDKGLFKVKVEKTEMAPPVANPLPDLNALRAQAQRSRIDLQATRQQSVVSQNALKLAVAQKIPDLQLSAGYLLARSPGPNGNRAFFGGPMLATTVTLPVFHNQEGEIAKINASLAQNRLRIGDLERQIQLDVDTAYSRLKLAQENINVYENTLIPSARNVVRLAVRSYEVGKTPLANVIMAQQSLQQVMSDYAQAIIDDQNAWGDLEKSVGVPLDAW
jgi:cobalt-zinc-cadmium efflux system outer membrane protein